MTEAANNSPALKFDEVGLWSELKLESVEKYGAAYTKAFARHPGLKKYYVDSGLVGEAPSSWVTPPLRLAARPAEQRESARRRALPRAVATNPDTGPIDQVLGFQHPGTRKA